ncbi:hypothetical protein [Streptomyces sp. NPDC101115]|uniref:hypothetical protein n=1 Tax=Streptomyces sp. NPDC101115 TaxID=3366106 RepID=UPI003804F98D
MGADIEGVIEVRGAGGRWEMAVSLFDFGCAREGDAWECLFGYPGGLGTLRALFDRRGVPEDSCEEVPKECDELNHGHSYATWAEVAAADWDAPLGDGPDGNRVGVWRPGPDGGLVLDGVVWTPVEVLDEAEEIFGEDLMPHEWPAGGEVPLDGAVYRPVVLTARLYAPPDGSWAPVWASMRELAAVHGDENVRVVVWFG